MRTTVRSVLTRDFAASARPCVGSSLTSPRARHSRLVILAALCCVWMGFLVCRLVGLQITSVQLWQEWALKQHFSQITLASERGPLYDRNGRLMAVSVPAGSVYVRPQLISNRDKLAKTLGSLLELPSQVIEEKLASSKPFVWIKRQVPRALAEQVSDLKISGVGHVLESKRYYPYNRAASVVIGKVGVDGIGLSGIEAAYEAHLHEDHIQTKVVRDAFGNFIQPVSESPEEFQLPKGNALKLTLDAGLQLIMDQELEEGRRRADAKAAMAVMLDASTGEILAMGQAPALNFNNATIQSKNDLKNLVVESVFEPGSIVKPLVAAAALEERVITPYEIVDCEGGRFTFGSHVIKDVHPYNNISLRDVIVRSSNIGMSKVGLRLGRERLYDYLSRFGFGASSKLGLPGETLGILRPGSSWAHIDVATHSFGQGVATTPLQIGRAMSVIANGGELVTLKIVADDEPGTRERVISPHTAQIVREMMYAVVEDEHGTGKLAAVPGVRVGGKTGTAQKARRHGRGYQPGAYVASFVGFVDAAPLGVPKVITLLVAIDEPQSSTIYGGTLAAPIFQKIMQRSLYTLSTSQDLKPGQPELGNPQEGAPAQPPRIVPVNSGKRESEKTRLAPVFGVKEKRAVSSIQLS